MDVGKIAYEAYVSHPGPQTGTSAPAPSWEALPQDRRDAFTASASAVLAAWAPVDPVPDPDAREQLRRLRAAAGDVLDRGDDRSRQALRAARQRAGEILDTPPAGRAR